MSLIRTASVNFDTTLRLCRNGSDRQRGIARTGIAGLSETELFSHIAVAVAADKFNRVCVIKLATVGQSIESIYTFTH